MNPLDAKISTDDELDTSFAASAAPIPTLLPLQDDHILVPRLALGLPPKLLIYHVLCFFFPLMSDYGFCISVNEGN